MQKTLWTFWTWTESINTFVTKDWTNEKFVYIKQIESFKVIKWKLFSCTYLDKIRQKKIAKTLRTILNWTHHSWGQNCVTKVSTYDFFFKIINENNPLTLEYLIKTWPKFLSKPCRQFSYLGPLWPNQSCLFNKSKHASVSSMIFWSCSFLTFMTFLLTVCGSKKEEGYSVAVFHYSRPLAPPSGSPSY